MPQQVERLRRCLGASWGVWLEPDFEARTLTATLAPTDEAPALFATGTAGKLLAYKGGSGGMLCAVPSGGGQLAEAAARLFGAADA